MAKKQATEEKAEKAKPAKAKKQEDLPAITGLHPLNPCRQYSTGRDGKRRPSERVFLADEMLRAKNTSLKDIQEACATRWAKAAVKAGDKRSEEDLVKVYRKAIPVNASTVNYMTDKFNLGAVIAKRSGEAVKFSFDEDAGTLTATAGGKATKKK